MKKCGRCGVEKPFSEFNKDRYTKSGYRSQCKGCMQKERLTYRDHYKEWRNDPERKAWYANYRRERRCAEQRKRAARNAVRKLARPYACQQCNKAGKVHGHHDDYALPLDIRWLCPACHSRWHSEHGEARNG